MIFATTGTQLPFPRLISALNALAPDLTEPIIAQVGPDPAPYPNLECRNDLDAAAFEQVFREARVIVAHAGIGTILSAKRHGKPLIVLPRRFDMGEHRNDHQIATAAHIQDQRGLHVARSDEDLKRFLEARDLAAAEPDPGPNLARLTSDIADWIAQ